MKLIIILIILLTSCKKEIQFEDNSIKLTNTRWAISSGENSSGILKHEDDSTVSINTQIFRIPLSIKKRTIFVFKKDSVFLYTKIVNENNNPYELNEMFSYEIKHNAVMNRLHNINPNITDSIFFRHKNVINNYACGISKYKKDSILVFEGTSKEYSAQQKIKYELKPNKIK
jgi:hypothetical protein